MMPPAVASLRAPLLLLGLTGCLSACAVGVDDLSLLDSSPPARMADAGADAPAPLGDGGPVRAADGGVPHVDAQASTDTGAGPGPGADGGRVMEAGALDTGSAGCGFSGALVTFDLSQEAGNEASVSPSATAAGVTAAPLTRSPALSSVSGAGSINSSGWTTASSLDPMRYYTFSVTPPAGCAATLTTLSVDSSASATGPTIAAAGTSADAFGSPAAVGLGGVSAVTLAGAAGAGGSIEIRVYAYAAGSTGGTFRIRNTLTLSGSLH